MGRMLFSDEFFPVMIVVVDGSLDAEDAWNYWAFEDELLMAGRPFCCISDLSTARLSQRGHKEGTQERLARLKDEMARTCLGTAVIVKNPLIKMALNIILAVRPLVMPHKVVSSLDEAVDWLSPIFLENGLRLPEREAVQMVLKDLHEKAESSEQD